MEKHEDKQTGEKSEWDSLHMLLWPELLSSSCSCLVLNFHQKMRQQYAIQQVDSFC